jgi:broad specificity phosphatase PhoE
MARTCHVRVRSGRGVLTERRGGYLGDVPLPRSWRSPDVLPHWTRGPVEIVLVRHGHSAGNAADDAARQAGAEVLDLSARDADVELSDSGREQAEALAGLLAGLDDGARPTRAVSSPYRRAAETAAVSTEPIGIELEVDERLRERDLGVLDGLTGTGIRSRFPEEAARREKLGKFYYQPPSGESWADVVLRVRSFLADVREDCDGDRLWLFTHQAVIMAFRYVLEGLSEEEVLDIDRTVTVKNASVTRYCRSGRRMELSDLNDTAHLERTTADVTEQPEAEEPR